MIIISYDISNTKLRTKFSKMLTKNGAIRLQYSVYEVNNTRRQIENIKLMIKNSFMKKFSMEDSVVIFSADNKDVEKFGNAIHRDNDLLCF